jgi:hypothetical protein
MAKSKLTPADNKFIEKFLNFNKQIDFDATKTFTRRNRFSGETFEVDPVCAAAIDFVFAVESSFGNEARLKQISPALTAGNAIQSFDRARMIVMKLNSSAYMGILD